MNLHTFKRIVRPDRVIALHDLDASADLSEIVLLFGSGEEDANKFKAVAGKLPFGSAVALTGLSESFLSELNQIVHEQHFCSWFKGSEIPEFPDDARTWVKHVYGDCYSTHKEILTRSVVETSGPVLELGAGFGSTELLHDLCKDRFLVTVDNDVSWLNKFASFETEKHVFQFLEDPAKTEWLDKDWSVVFVDHAPGETRLNALLRARNKSDFIVVHDTEDLGYGLEDVLSSFKFRRDFRTSRPWTTVVSMSREIWK